MPARYFSYLLIGIFLFRLLAVPAPCRAASVEQQQQTIKQKLFEIAPGTILIVKTRGKEQLRGRFQGMTDDGLTMQIVKGDAVTERTLAFSEVKSLKAENKHGAAKTAGWIILGGLAALGTLLVVALAVAAAHGWD